MYVLYIFVILMRPITIKPGYLNSTFLRTYILLTAKLAQFHEYVKRPIISRLTFYFAACIF